MSDDDDEERSHRDLHHPTGPPVPRKITNISNTGGPNATMALRILLYSGGVYGAWGGATARGAGDVVRS